MEEKSNHSDSPYNIIEEIYQERYRFIFKYACGFLSSPEDIQDFVQETFARFCRGFEMHSDFSKSVLIAYLFRIMQNLKVDILKERSRSKRISLTNIEDVPDPKQFENVSFSSTTLADVIQKLDEISPKYALFLKMKYWGDFSDDEIAGALGVKKDSLRMIHSRARAQLKYLLRKEDM